jgi:hypothetical protein
MTRNREELTAAGVGDVPHLRDAAAAASGHERPVRARALDVPLEPTQAQQEQPCRGVPETDGAVGAARDDSRVVIREVDLPDDAARVVPHERQEPLARLRVEDVPHGTGTIRLADGRVILRILR